MRRSLLDQLAIGASAACLIHCLLIPLAIAAVPALSQVVGTPEWLHLALFASAVPVSAVALTSGYRHHGAWLPAIFGMLGLALIGAGALAGLPWFVETGMTVAGSLALAGGHLSNWRLRRRTAGAVPA